MKVLAYDVYPNDAGREIAQYVGLDALLAESDVVTLHCNLTPDNTGLINKKNIAKMKDGAILINNARGQLIVEQDVADALNSGKLAAAGLDVVYTEPIRADNPLLQAKNCILTPHISWAPKESRQRIMGGFGGSNKNIGIGCADGRVGKAMSAPRKSRWLSVSCAKNSARTAATGPSSEASHPSSR